MNSVVFGMHNQKNNETKQKIAIAVSEYFLRSIHDPLYKRQPYMAHMLKSSIEKALMQSYVQMYHDRDLAEVDYENQRFCVTTKNPHVLTVYNLVRENVSER
jgi:predicted transcriptional regulator